jgi:hypothetical protein
MMRLIRRKKARRRINYYIAFREGGLCVIVIFLNVDRLTWDADVSFVPEAVRFASSTECMSETGFLAEGIIFSYSMNPPLVWKVSESLGFMLFRGFKCFYIDFMYDLLDRFASGF